MGDGIGFIYHKKNDSNITYINTNMDDGVRHGKKPFPEEVEMDLDPPTILLVEIKPEQAPVFTPISLTDKKMKPIEFYDLKHLRKIHNLTKIK